MEFIDLCDSTQHEYLKNDFVKDFNQKNNTDYKIQDVEINFKKLFDDVIEKYNPDLSEKYEYFEDLIPDPDWLSDIQELGIKISDAYKFFQGKKNVLTDANNKLAPGYQYAACQILNQLYEFESDPYVFNQFKESFLQDNEEMDVYSSECGPYEVLENLCVMRIIYEGQNLAFDLENCLSDALDDLDNQDENKNILEDYIRIKPELVDTQSDSNSKGIKL